MQAIPNITTEASSAEGDVRVAIFERLAKAAEQLAGKESSPPSELKVLPFVRAEASIPQRLASDAAYNSPELLRYRLMQSVSEPGITDNDRLLLVHRMYHLETNEEWLSTTNATELLRMLDPRLKPANASTSLRLMTEKTPLQVEVLQSNTGHREKSFRLTAAGLLWVKCLLAGLVYAHKAVPD